MAQMLNANIMSGKPDRAHQWDQKSSYPSGGYRWRGANPSVTDGELEYD